MRKKHVNKLIVNWSASFLSVVILLSIVAAPALAAIVANSVNSSSIVDGSIRTRDIRRDAITTSRIKNHSIRKEDIRSGSINKYKLTSNSVNTYKIADGTIKNADISPSAGISDSKIDYSTKTRHYSLSPAAFSSGSGLGPVAVQSAGPGLAPDGSSLIPPGPTMAAPVSLPDGANVTKLLFAVYDNASDDASATLMRTDRSENADVLVGVSSDGTGTSPREFSSSAVTNPVIDNANYSYYVMINVISPSPRIDGVFITYQVTGP